MADSALQFSRIVEQGHGWAQTNGRCNILIICTGRPLFWPNNDISALLKLIIKRQSQQETVPNPTYLKMPG